ncbi:MAG: methyltransferase-like protein, partial [Arcobacteraceae bacterium]
KTRQMIEQLEIKISTPKSQNIYYEVTKQVHVREYPSSSNKSGKLDILYPKHKLFIIQSKPYWIQVEYFNERLHETIIGWVSKRYTKKLSKENITK